jgi:hypothetical protein
LIDPTLELLFLRTLVIVVISVAVFAVARERFRRNVLTVEICPKCGGSEFSRIHRTRRDRFFGIGMNLHRYRCKNPDCSWEGLAQVFHSDYRRRNRAVK